jgi:hypothetical protein
VGRDLATVQEYRGERIERFEHEPRTLAWTEALGRHVELQAVDEIAFFDEARVSGVLTPERIGNASLTEQILRG